MTPLEYYCTGPRPIEFDTDISKSELIEMIRNDLSPDVRAEACHLLILEAETIAEAIDYFIHGCRDADRDMQRYHLVPLCDYLIPEKHWHKFPRVKVKWWNQEFTFQLKHKILNELTGKIDPINLPLELVIRGALKDDSIVDVDWMSNPELQLLIKRNLYIRALIALSSDRAKLKLQEMATNYELSYQRKITYDLISLGQYFKLEELNRYETDASIAEDKTYWFATASMGYESSFQEVLEIINAQEFSIWQNVVTRFFFQKLKDLPFECEVIRNRMNLILGGNYPSSQ